MPIHLHFSNKIEALADCLGEWITEYYGRGALGLSPVEILIPNMNLTRWLQMQLARTRGVACNLDFTFLETGLWRALKEFCELPDEAQCLNKSARRIFLTRLLIEGEQVEVIEKYLNSAGTSKQNRQIRAWDLAGAMAQHFEDYEYHRLELIREWKSGVKVENDDILSCSQSLYAACESAAVSNNYHSLFDLVERAALSPEEIKKPLFCFGFGQVSRLHMEVLSQISSHRPVHLLHLNPSAEYWEDTERSSRSTQAKIFKHHFKTINDEEHLDVPWNYLSPLLEHWGKPGVESVQMLCELSNYDFDDQFEDLRTGNLLAELQHQLLHSDYSGNLNLDLSHDCSVSICTAPSKITELQNIYNQIATDLANDETLSPCDIAILIPDLESYRTAIYSVFDQYRQLDGEACLPIPFNLVDIAASSDSHFGQAVIGLLNLVSESANRESLFRLLNNPCVSKAFDYQQEEIQYWTNLVDKLKVFKGLQYESNLSNWQVGLARLRAAVVAPPYNENWNYSDISHNSLLSLPEKVSNYEDALKLVDVLTNILFYARQFNTSQTPTEWKELLIESTNNLFKIPEDSRGEKTVHSSFLRGLEGLELFDDETISFELLKLYTTSTLKGINGGRGQFLADGITIAALQPLRPIPFRHIYIPGLDEDSFPGRRLDSSLDLRGSTRRKGEFSTPERNRYLLLETLCAAREKINFSYSCMDLVKDREINPSPVILELIAELQRILSDHTDSEIAFPVQSLPIHETGNFELKILLKPSGEFTVADLPEPSQRSHTALTALEEPSTSTNTKAEISDKLSYRKLSSIIRNPLKAHALQRHKLNDPSESNEKLWQLPGKPLSLNHLDIYGLFRGSLAHLLTQLILNHEFQSKIFEAGFEESDKEFCMQILYEYHQRQIQFASVADGCFGEQNFQIMRKKYDSALTQLASVFNQYPPRKSKNGSYEFYRLISVGDPKIDLTQPELSDHILRIKSPWLIKNQDKELTVDASNDWVFIDSENRFHSFFMESSSEIKPKNSFEVQMFLGLLDCCNNYASSYGLHSLGTKAETCTSFVRKAFNQNRKAQFMNALDTTITEYFSDDCPLYLPYGMLFNSKIDTAINDSFDKFAESGHWSDFPEDFDDSYEEALNEILESSKDHQAHHAKDLEKLIIPLLNKKSKPNINKIIEAIRIKYILGRNMECTYE